MEIPQYIGYNIDMLISFTGAQCTGKSTLLSRMLSDSKFRKCTFIKEVTRKVAAQGIKINADGDNITQLFILSEHLHNHYLPGCVVLDRCILDGYIYTKWLNQNGKVDDWVLDHATKLHDILVDKLDVIFYTNPIDVDLVSDGQRSVDVKFRDDIINMYGTYFDSHPDVYNKTVTLSGTVDQRMKQILNTFKQHEQVR